METTRNAASSKTGPGGISCQPGGQTTDFDRNCNHIWQLDTPQLRCPAPLLYGSDSYLCVFCILRQPLSGISEICGTKPNYRSYLCLQPSFLSLGSDHQNKSGRHPFLLQQIPFYRQSRQFSQVSASSWKLHHAEESPLRDASRGSICRQLQYCRQNSFDPAIL